MGKIEPKTIELEHLPHKNNNINWNECKGYSSKFQYGEVVGEIKYLQYENRKIHFIYNKKEYAMGTSDLKSVKLGSIVTLPKKEKPVKEQKKKETPNYVKIIKQEYIEYLKNKEDIDREDITYNTELECICPSCGYEKTYKAGVLACFGFSCNGCSTGFTYPNRFLNSLLKEMKNNNLIKDYELEKTIENKRYDGYIPSIGIIIEMHGEQHYKQSGWGKNVKEEQKNDKYKKTLAETHNIQEDKYIEIDCSKSNFNFIKNNILNSNLNKIFDLSSINWDKIDSEIAEDTIMEDIIKLWNEGYCNKEIKEKLKIKSKNTITKYLKIGARKGLCNYTIEESGNRSSSHCGKSIKIYCETNNKIYNTKKELKLNSEKDFGVKLGIKLINRMLERPLDTDMIKISYVKGGEFNE